MLPAVDSLKAKNTHNLKVRGWKRYFLQTEMTSKWGVAYSDKIDFKTNSLKTLKLTTKKGII